MAQIVVADIDAYDPTLKAVRTLRFSTQGYVTGATPIADPRVDTRITVVRSGTATRYNSSGLVESVASNATRFDYEPLTKALRGLLVEESRVNTALQSENWTNASWTKATITATGSSGTAPNGLNQANKLTPDSGVLTTNCYAYQTATLSGARVVSVYAKEAGYNLLLNSGPYTDQCWAVFRFATKDFDTGTNVAASGYEELPNGWFRVWIRVANSITNFSVLVGAVNGTTFSGAGNGDGTSGVLVWGAQSEAGSFLTSYIPTTTGSVTRAADVLSMTGTNFTSWHNASTGTLFAEGSTFKSVYDAFAMRFAELSDGTTANRQIVDVSPGGFNRAISINSGTIFDGTDDAYTTGTVTRIALAYATNDFASSANGRTPLTDNSGAVPTANRLSIGSSNDGTTSYTNGHIRRIYYWPTRLTNAQLQAITLGQSIPSGATLALEFTDGAHALYEGRIQQAANVSRSCFQDQRTFGRTQIGFGDMTLVNNDGALDYLLNYSFAGRSIHIRLGTVLANSGGVPSWVTVLRGTMEQAELSWQRVTFRVRDRQQDLAKPLQQTRYAGNSTSLEGGADLEGKPKPIVFGKVLNVSPPQTDTTRRIYQVHNASALQSLDAVYDRGATLTAGAAYASQADMETNAPAAGQYRVWNSAAGCFFRLGSAPSGLVTCDATQGAATSNRTPAQLFSAILTAAGVASSDISSADITALDAVAAYESGVYCPHDREVSPLELMDELCSSVGAWYGTDATGVFRIGQIVLPTGADVGVIRTPDIIGIERVASRDPGVGVPAWKIKLGYQKVYSVQTDLGTGVTDARKSFVSSQYRRAEASDAAVKEANATSPELEFNTVLHSKANASSEASRRLAIYNARRDMYEVTVRVDASLASVLDIGKIVTLEVPRFGMNSGKKFLIIGLRTNMRGYLFDLTLWG